MKSDHLISLQMFYYFSTWKLGTGLSPAYEDRGELHLMEVAIHACCQGRESCSIWLPRFQVPSFQTVWPVRTTLIEAVCSRIHKGSLNFKCKVPCSSVSKKVAVTYLGDTDEGMTCNVRVNNSSLLQVERHLFYFNYYKEQAQKHASVGILAK